jgi:hypothetical protein
MPLFSELLKQQMMDGAWKYLLGREQTCNDHVDGGASRIARRDGAGATENYGSATCHDDKKLKLLTTLASME